MHELWSMKCACMCTHSTRHSIIASASKAMVWSYVHVGGTVDSITHYLAQVDMQSILCGGFWFNTLGKNCDKVHSAFSIFVQKLQGCRRISDAAIASMHAFNRGWLSHFQFHNHKNCIFNYAIVGMHTPRPYSAKSVAPTLHTVCLRSWKLFTKGGHKLCQDVS